LGTQSPKDMVNDDCDLSKKTRIYTSYIHAYLQKAKVDVDKLAKRANAFILGIERKCSMDRVKKG
jgi:hypothetical protein